MNYSKKGLIMILVLMAIGVSGAYANVGTTFSDTRGGSSSTVNEGFGSTGAVDSSLSLSSGVAYASTSFTTPYTFYQTVGNLEGDYAGVSVDVAGLAPKGTHTYGSNIATNSALFWQTLDASQADWIETDAWAGNAMGDYADVYTYVDSWSYLNSFYWGDAAVTGNWQVAEAFNNAAFAAQGLTAAQGGYMDIYTEASPYSPQYAESYVYAYTEDDYTYLNNFASWAVSVNGGANVVAELNSGYVQNLDSGGYTDMGVYAYNAYKYSSVDSYADGVSGMTASPHMSTWPGLAYAGMTTTLTMFETQTTGTFDSYMEAYGGLAYSQKGATVGTFDYAGVGASGQTAGTDAAFVAKA